MATRTPSLNAHLWDEHGVKRIPENPLWWHRRDHERGGGPGHEHADLDRDEEVWRPGGYLDEDGQIVREW